MPKSESLVIIKDLFNTSNKKIKLFLVTVIVPIIEELVFRILPSTTLVITPFAITASPVLILPAIVTAITGTFIFSYAHTLADKLLNKREIRKWTTILPKSIVLTGIYLGLLIAFPEQMFLAPTVTIVLHSLNNILSVITRNVAGLAVFENNEKKEVLEDKDFTAPVIEQSLIDNLISDISDKFYLDRFKELKGVIQELSNLPEDINERYNIVVNQIFNLVEILKEYSGQVNASRFSSFGEDLIPMLVPFVTLLNLKDNKELFYSIIDSLLSGERLVERKYDVLSEAGSFIANVYTINPDFVPYIIKRMLSVGLIKEDEQIPYTIDRKLKDTGYDALKQYYFAIASMQDIDENLSKVLADNVKILKDNIIPLVANKDLKQSVTGITIALDELTDKINTKTMPLLEQHLNSLFEIAMKVKDRNRNLSFQIIKVILSISKQIILENKDINAKKIKIEGITSVLIEEYDNNSDSTIFKDTISQLIDICQPISNDNFDSFNKQVVEILTNAASHVYEPIATNKIKDVNSEEYKNRKKIYLDIYRRMSVRRLNDTEIFDCLFNIKKSVRNRNKTGMGFNQETFDIFLNAMKNSGTVFYLDLPDDDNFISGDIEQFADKIVDSIDNVNPLFFIMKVLGITGYASEKESIKAKQMAIYIIDKLFKTANDKTKDLKTRTRVIKVLFDIISRGIYKDKYENISLDFDNIRELMQEVNIPAYIYLGNTSIDNPEGYSEYDFTPLIKFLPESLFKDKSIIKTKSPVITEVTGKTDKTKPEVQQMLFRFEVLQKILEYNTSVLTLLDTIKDSKNYDKNITELLKELQEMIDELKKINLQHGTDAQIALENIKLFLNSSELNINTLIKINLLLSSWSVNTIKDIEEIHTLINAVHQTAIADFKQELGNLSKVIKDKDDNIQTITSQQISTITGYNLSDNINSNIVKFMAKLATRKLPQDKIDDFICKDDLVVWSTRLNAHSVDIFFNFGETDRGISIYYRERPSSVVNVGQEGRVKYFEEILKYLGFHVDIDTQISNGMRSYTLKGILNKDYGLNESMDLIDIATHVVEVFKYSTNLDYDLKSRSKDTYYNEVFEKWLEKVKRREAWYGVSVNNSGLRAYGYGQSGIKLELLPEKRNLDISSLNNVLSYLGCDLLPEGTTSEDLKDPRFINKYFNNPIERAYFEGKLIVNEDSVLVRNEGYNIIDSVVEEVTKNIEETSIQSKIINLVNNYEFNTRILANIGGFVIISSVMNLTNGDKLFIKGIMDSNTRRMKYAITERVSSAKRQKLTSDELIKILKQEGYEIAKPEFADTRERKRIRNLLSRDIRKVESPNVPCISTSEGNGISVVGNITFDKDSVDENSILVVPYTTPDDMKFIEKSKGIITSGGGILSHAAITTRELEKPSVIFNSANWTNNKELEILYYLPFGDIKVIDNEYNVQELKAKRKTLKEGSRVLMNGETGMVLLFDDMDNGLLDELQQYIDTDNTDAVLEFMKKHIEDEKINRYVEYVYFQAIGNKKAAKILDLLLSENMPDIVKKKFNELNDSYIQDKVQSISEAVENIKTIYNVNIVYNIVGELKKKLSFIRTSEKREDIETLKEQIKTIEKETKEKLNRYMQAFIKEARGLLNKGKMDIKDIQRAILMLKNVEIYNYFVSDSETSNDLLTKKEIIRDFVPALRNKLNSYEIEDEGEDLQEEISLFEEKASNEKKFGSKTAQLAKMFKILKKKFGVTVPNGMGISVTVMPMLFKSVGKENLLSEFEEAIKDKNKRRAKELAKMICDVIDSNEFTGTEIENGIKERLNTFVKPGINYSVRSSGVGEDATNNAFAGMGETELNVKYENIYENVKKCWKSFFADRCIDYMVSSGQVVKPAVLVQEMIDSEISGVVFSRNKYGNGTINSVFGQGEGIVSGMFTPDNILFDMNTGEIIEYSVADKQFELVTDENGGLKQVAVGRKARSRTLSTKEVKKLAEVMKLLENYSGYPIDVEFAVRGEELYILQMRPITTLDKKEKETPDNEEAIDRETKEIKCEIELTTGKIEKEQEVFVNIANPLKPEESIPVYFEMEKTADGYSYKYIVDSKYKSIINIVRQLLSVRSNEDSVIRNKINSYLSVFSQAKEGEIEILPPLSDTLDSTEIEENINVNINGIKNLLASA
ncbi:MAG: hypothetical protein K5622_01900 [Endomicrobiaceae bacterium]|nr:hypothetical protein [Endomicrobiaceae bacterium]